MLGTLLNQAALRKVGGPFVCDSLNVKIGEKGGNFFLHTYLEGWRVARAVMRERRNSAGILTYIC